MKKFFSLLLIVLAISFQSCKKSMGEYIVVSTSISNNFSVKLAGKDTRTITWVPIRIFSRCYKGRTVELFKDTHGDYVIKPK